MTSKIETGHAKNVANFEQLVSFCAGYGTTYNPSKAAIKLTAMQTLSTNAKNALNAVNSALAALDNAVAARQVAFEPFSKFTTRVMNALKATDVAKQVEDNARSFVRKIQGSRATPKKTEIEKKTIEAEGKVVKEISSSQMSFDSRLDNFDKLIKLLAGIALYSPNETDLKVTALTTLYNDLKSKNNAVISALTTLSNARLTRNEIINNSNAGLVSVASDAKAYIKSLYGASSAQYKQISGLEFKTIKV